MELKEYIDGCKRTENSLAPLAQSVVDLGLTNRLYHGIVGISTEMGEISEAYEKDEIDFVNVAEEIGDAFWYLMIIFSELNITEVNTPSLEPINCYKKPLTLFSQSADMLDKTKKTMFYGKEYSVEVLEEQATRFYVTLCRLVDGLKEELDVTKEKIWDINLNKLKIRYPDKFSLNDAEVRDLKTERIALEKIHG